VNLAFPAGRHRKVAAMMLDARRLLILSKLADGRLPIDSISRVWGGPGNGEICDGCETVITKKEFIVESDSPADGTAPPQLHAPCFWIWEDERRPKLRVRESGSRRRPSVLPQLSDGGSGVGGAVWLRA
jgi:hypothetical protein